MVSVTVRFRQELKDVFLLKPSVASAADAVGLYHPLVAPSPHRVVVDIENLGHFPYC